jgi:hypothetical protein
MLIESFSGDTNEVIRLRTEINKALNQRRSVKVKLWQPGIMYQDKDQWKTVIDFMNEFKGKPVHFFSNLVPLKQVDVDFTYTNDMFISNHRLYLEDKKCVALLEKVNSSDLRPEKTWDLLLGRQTDVKDELYEMILSHDVFKTTFLTYFKDNTDHGHWGNDVLKPKFNSAETIDGNMNAFDNPVRHSDLIDPSIYSQTSYSAMIETVIHNDFAMFSEKEAKPIMAKRPFVIFGSRHQLKAFRQLGFKTFSPVIDESYDDIHDRKKRFMMVLDAMNKLSKKNRTNVLKELQDVLNHNRNHFLEHSWTKV